MMMMMMMMMMLLMMRSVIVEWSDSFVVCEVVKKRWSAV